MDTLVAVFETEQIPEANRNNNRTIAIGTQRFVIRIARDEGIRPMARVTLTALFDDDEANPATENFRLFITKNWNKFQPV